MMLADVRPDMVQIQVAYWPLGVGLLFLFGILCMWFADRKPK